MTMECDVRMGKTKRYGCVVNWEYSTTPNNKEDIFPQTMVNHFRYRVDCVHSLMPCAKNEKE